MTLNEVRGERKELERNIHKVINEELNVFKRKTGISPNDVDISFIQSDELGVSNPGLRIGNVKVTIIL